MNSVRLVISAVTESGSVRPGALYAGFRIGGSGTAAVGAVPVTSLQPFNTPALPQGVFFDSIPYTISGGTLYIIEVRE